MKCQEGRGGEAGMRTERDTSSCFALRHVPDGSTEILEHSKGISSFHMLITDGFSGIYLYVPATGDYQPGKSNIDSA